MLKGQFFFNLKTLIFQLYIAPIEIFKMPLTIDGMTYRAEILFLSLINPYANAVRCGFESEQDYFLGPP